MACFVITAGEAVLVTAAQVAVHVLEKKGKITTGTYEDGTQKVKLSKKMSVLNTMLWGGSVLLALEHVFHGEVTFTFPFLTAVSNGETTEMLHEMGTVGVTMAAVLTGVWAIGLLIHHFVMKKRHAKVVEKQTNLVKE